MKIKIVPAYAYPQEISSLFAEYTDRLVAGDSRFWRYLETQHYDEELRHLPDNMVCPMAGFKIVNLCQFNLWCCLCKIPVRTYGSLWVPEILDQRKIQAEPKEILLVVSSM